MQSNSSTYRTVLSTQHKATQHTDVALPNAISVSLAIALPLVVVGAIVTYQKHRARVLRERIQRLNQLWQLNTSKKTS